MVVSVFVLSEGVGAGFEVVGYTCSAVTSKRRKAVPSGVQVISVISGLLVS